MTKAEFILALKDSQPEIFPTKSAAEKAFSSFCEILATSIASKQGVRLPKIGSFSVIQRAARTGRNPRTGKAIKIPARKAVKFSPSQTLADKVK